MEGDIIKNQLWILDELIYELHLLNKACVKYRDNQIEERAMLVTSSLLAVDKKMSYTIAILQPLLEMLSSSISIIIENAIPIMDFNNDTALTVKSLVESSLFDNDEQWYTIEIEKPLSIKIDTKNLSTFTIVGLVNIELPKLQNILHDLKLFFDDYKSKFNNCINGDLIDLSRSVSNKKEDPRALTPLLPSEAWIMDIIENDLRIIKNMFAALFSNVKIANILVSEIVQDIDSRKLA